MTKASDEDNGKHPRVLKYLCGTQEIGLVLDCRQGMALEVFADASHAVHDAAKGPSGAISHIGNASVYSISS